VGGGMFGIDLEDVFELDDRFFVLFVFDVSIATFDETRNAIDVTPASSQQKQDSRHRQTGEKAALGKSTSSRRHQMNPLRVANEPEPEGNKIGSDRVRHPTGARHNGTLTHDLEIHESGQFEWERVL